MSNETAGWHGESPHLQRGEDITIEPDQIRAEIDGLLAQLASDTDADLDEIARRLNELHDVLVRALESVEKG